MAKPDGHGPLGATSIRRILDTLRSGIEPRCELDYETPFQLLVAVVLSAQCTDKTVNNATRKLFPAAGTPYAIFALGEDGLAPYIRTIGLWRAKSRHVIGLCRALIDRHGGEVPADRDALQALPGVGRKTASVVLNVAFGQPTIAVDTHVQRVTNRLGICTTDHPDDTEQVLEQRIPADHRMHAHHLFILHGRYTCTARGPKCGDCPVSGWCRRIGVE